MARGLSRRARRGAVYCAIVAVTGVSAPLGAATFTAFWAQPVSGQWVDAANWTTADYPHNNGTDVYEAGINAVGSPYTVSLNGGTISLDALRLTSRDATLSLTPTRLFINRYAFIQFGALGDQQGGTVSIGQSALVASQSKYQISGGTFSTPELQVGFDGGQFIQTGGVVRQIQTGIEPRAFIGVRAFSGDTTTENGPGQLIVDG